MAVLAAVGEGEARRIGEPAGSAVHHLGHHRQRPHRAGADAGNEKQLAKSAGPRFAAAAKLACRRGAATSLARTS